MAYICLNGKLALDTKPVLPASDRSYRYGDGLFETMRVKKGKLILSDFHFERLSNSMQVLKYEAAAHFTKEFFETEIIRLCQKNKCQDSARVRFSVSRGEGGLYDKNNLFRYLIECWPLESETGQLNETGLVIDIYPDAHKSTHKFSNLKSASFLPYVMAAQWAQEKRLNDALILNSFDRVADSTIANIFWVKDGIIYTPPLSEGCIAGVMRRYLIEKSVTAGFELKEQKLEVADLENAQEVFLTNAVRYIRWVKQFRNKQYGCLLSSKIYDTLVRTIDT